MSLLQKLFKRNRESRNSVSELNTSNQTDDESKGLLSSFNNNWYKSSEDSSDKERTSKMKQLRHNLKTLQRQNSRLRRRQQEVVALDAEVTQVVTLIHMAKRQIAALDEDVLNKKCELNFLRNEVSSEEFAEVKKIEPVYHKRYTLTKNNTEIIKLLQEIRERQRIFSNLEVMLYEKYLDLKHNLSGFATTKRTGSMLKNKQRHFEHLSDSIHHRRKISGNGVMHSTHAQNSPTAAREVQCQNLTSVEITPRTEAPPSGGIVSLFPTGAPLLQPQVDNNPMVFIPMAPPLPHMESTV